MLDARSRGGGSLGGGKDKDKDDDDDDARIEALERALEAATDVRKRAANWVSEMTERHEECATRREAAEAAYGHIRALVRAEEAERDKSGGGVGERRLMRLSKCNCC